MIEEAYVNFETAKLLKEKGFDEKCFALYNHNGKLIQSGIRLNNTQVGRVEGSYSASTLQMAMKWLRKEKGIAAVPILSSVLDNEKFLWDIEITVAKTNETYHQGWIYESQERACEAAIKYCLENLI